MKILGATTDFDTAPTVDGVPITGGIGYWVLKANGASTFPARSTIPAWWTGAVQYDSTAYLNHSNPSDMVTGDQHLKRTS